MAFVTAPHTGPLHLRAADLLAAGLPVALGQDDIADAYYPYGQHNLLEVAFLASHLLGWTTAAEMDTLLDMITTQGARVLRLTGYGLDVGKEAHLCVLQGETPQEVLTRHEPPSVVISHGRLAAETHAQTEILETPRR
jgi:cytosine deaminase